VCVLTNVHPARRCDDPGSRVGMSQGVVNREPRWPGVMYVEHSRLGLVTDASEVPQSLIDDAGEFFKRFDRKTCTFVSAVDHHPSMSLPGSS
jgi:hypothetical protein